MTKQMTRFLTFGAIGVALALANQVTVAEAQNVDRKIAKQISIMEKIIDEAMVESKYALVQSTHPTHGIYLEGYGPVFSIEIGLVDSEWWWDNHSIFKGDISVMTDEDEDGDKVITIRRGKGKKTEEESRKVLDDNAKYKKVKEELVEVIRDYGDTIARAKPNEYFTIFASPRSTSWGDNDFHRLVVRAKMQDISDYNAGKLNAGQFQDRVEIVEY